MQLTTRGRYAVMAMVELARVDMAERAQGRDGARVCLADLADEQQLSLCYLEQLFAGLRRAGLVEASRGPGGGYRLTRPPAGVTVGDVLRAAGEPMRVTRCAPGEPGCLPDGRRRCRTHDLWAALERHVAEFLDRVTIADVASGVTVPLEAA